MSTRIRPWVALVAVGVIVLSVLAAVSRRSGEIRPQKPANADTAQAPASQPGGEVGGVPAPAAKSADREPVRIAVARKAKVILRDGRIVPAKEGRASLSNPGVMAVVYEGAPPAAVQRLKEILESGSNEYPDFTKSEKYPPWVYDKIREMLPGKLGQIIARIAKETASFPAEGRPQPVLDLSDQGETGYACMYLVADDVMRFRLGALSHIVPVAYTKFGTAVVNKLESGWSAAPGPGDLAVWLAHRLAAGDNRIRLPRIPPDETYGDDWESWVRGSIDENLAREFEDAGLLTKRRR